MPEVESKIYVLYACWKMKGTSQQGTLSVAKLIRMCWLLRHQQH